MSATPAHTTLQREPTGGDWSTSLPAITTKHLLIICGEGRQCWTVAIRPQNRPLRTVEVEWNETQDVQPLMEKLDGIVFEISEEDRLSITDVVDRVRNVFMENAESVTRKFYEKFRRRAFGVFRIYRGDQRTGIQGMVCRPHAQPSSCFNLFYSEKTVFG